MSIGYMPPCGKLIDIIYTLGKSSKMNIGDKAPELLGINEKEEKSSFISTPKIALPAVRLRLAACVTITQNCVRPDTK